MEAQRALEYARRHRSRFLAELAQMLRIPSVSAQTKHAGHVKSCAFWLADHLRHIGLTRARIIATRGHPIVYASWLHAPGRPTLLIYGHYDVLPGEPLQGWHSQPFRPVLRGAHLYARGASDDKGQLFCHLKAMECYLRTSRLLPVNVKCLFEGEEEIGSPSLTSFIQRHKRALKADAVVISDTRMLGPHRPAISYAQRGGLSAEITVNSERHELHSGNFGGAIQNPIQTLAEILSGLHDDQGRIALPGFYNSVKEIAPKERIYMAQYGPSDADILRDASSDHPWGEPGYSLYERTTSRPALTISGIAGGHQGPGVKSIIPASAIAKLSFRLVPDQDPREVAQQLQHYLDAAAPPAQRVSLRTFAPIQPALMDRNHAAFRHAALAYQQAFGAPPVYLRSGGSIPVITTFQKNLRCPVILMGFGLPDSRIHAADENLHLPTFFRAIDTCIWYQAFLSSPHQSGRSKHPLREVTKA